MTATVRYMSLRSGEGSVLGVEGSVLGVEGSVLLG
jgi:hypothetical protein